MNLNLEQLAYRLARVDQMIVSLLGIRKGLALQVEEFKRQNGGKIIRLDIEKQRIAQAAKWAKEYGVNPDFARTIMYQTINESCKEQFHQMEKSRSRAKKNNSGKSAQEVLKKNLLQLTKEVAVTYQDSYVKKSAATNSYFDFESAIIERELKCLKNYNLALDLGCANGPMTLKLSGHFSRVIGIDISPHMIEIAKKDKKVRGLNNVEFVNADIENGIPCDDSSVSFVVMNFGTASDIPSLKFVLEEIQRVLMPGGKVFLSFYNANALLYRWEYIPWQPSLGAQFNRILDCLDVRAPSKKTYRIFGKLYTKEDVIALMPREIEVIRVKSYPTVESILPNESINDSENARQTIEVIDKELSKLDLGAYLIVVGTKKP